MRQPPNEISGLRYFYVWMAVGFIARNKAKDLCCLIHTYDMVKDIVEQNKAITSVTREKAGLKEYFPQCFDSEGCFDIDKFREAIETQVDVVREGRSYDFLGKSYARMLSSLDTTTVLRPDLEHNSKPENANSENIYISGDNLDALQHLVKSYSGQVKCIYIDPPYNTGTDGFVYKDRFNFSADELEQKLSINHEEAEKIIAMTSGRRASHAAWLTFMMPRLLLAKDLLKKDGVIFISIDDNEQAYLKQLCDFIFGEDNMIGQIVVQSNPRGRQSDTFIATVHDYLLCYARNTSKTMLKGQSLTEKQEEEFCCDDGDGRKYRLLGLRQRGVASLREDRPDMFFPIFVNPQTKEISLEAKDGWSCVIPKKSDGRDGRWMWGFDKCKKEIQRLVPRFVSRRGEFDIDVKDYLEKEDGERSRKYKSIWVDKVINNQNGTQEVSDLLGGTYCDYPKPSEYIKMILEFANVDNCLILDFFGGSATTAESVMKLNIDGYDCNYIIVQLPFDLNERLLHCDSSKRKQIENTIKWLNSLGYPTTYDYVGFERIKRAAKKIKETNPLFAGDLGFKHYTIEEVPQNTLDKLETYNPDTILSTDDTLNLFGRETVITTWLLRDGYGLGAKTKDIMLGDYKATFCGHHLYLTDSGFSVDNMRELETLYMEDPSFNPDYIVLFGYSFSHNEKELLENNGSSLYSLRDKRPTIDIRY